VNEIRKAPIEPGMPVPPVLVVCPPAICAPRGALADKFSGAEARCDGLANAYRSICTELGCHFFDAGSVTPSSRVDGIHLDADQHVTLGTALADVVAGLQLDE
jgi:lysophospholipase L1-like esterase